MQTLWTDGGDEEDQARSTCLASGSFCKQFGSSFVLKYIPCEAQRGVGMERCGYPGGGQGQKRDNDGWIILAANSVDGRMDRWMDKRDGKYNCRHQDVSIGGRKRSTWIFVEVPVPRTVLSSHRSFGPYQPWTEPATSNNLLYTSLGFLDSRQPPSSLGLPVWASPTTMKSARGSCATKMSWPDDDPRESEIFMSWFEPGFLDSQGSGSSATVQT
jgi:hypothetical protein